jgi:DNA-binding PadR family transcriptional regulator
MPPRESPANTTTPTTIQGDALRGHLQTLILSTLRTAPAHGFEILRRLESAGAGLLKLKEGSLYPALYRLESAKLIAGQWEDPASTRRGPRRRIYRLTPKGRRRFMTAAAEFHQFVSVLTKIVGAAT